MNVHSLPNFIVSTYILALGIFAIRANRNSPVNRVFLALSIISFIWLFGYGLLYSTSSHEAALWIAKIGHCGAVLLVAAVYWLIIAVIGSYSMPSDKIWVNIVTLCSILAATLVFATPEYFAGISMHSWGYYPYGGPLMFIYTLWTIIVGIRCFAVLNRVSKMSAKDLNRENYLKIKYFTVSVVIFIFSAVDFFPKFGLNIYPFGFIFVAIFSTLITFAIIKHRLFDVEFVIRRSFVYSSLVAIFSISQIFLILFAERILRAYIGYASLIAAFIASTIMTIAFIPLRMRLQNFTDRLFLLQDPQDVLRENNLLKAAIKDQDRMRSIATLAAGMAHEIKNPLTSIRTFAEYLPAKYDDPQFRSKFSSIVVAEVDRINGIVKQLLEFSKPSEPKLTDVPLAAILDDTLSLMSNDMLSRGVRLDLDIDRDLRVFADANQLKQAFLNILLNSLQSMPSSGILSVSASPHLSYARIDVSDTGCGIPDDQIRHIFDPFYTTKETGSGLGMAIVHSIIQSHGGRIEVHSKVGRGTTITLYLRPASG